MTVTTQKPTSEMTSRELLSEIGSTLGEIGRYYAERMGLRNPNPHYPPLPENTPLYINCKPYSVRRAKDGAERDLVSLANEVPYEGSWFYTPQDSIWYHISEGHKEEFGPRGQFELSSIVQKNIKLKIRGKEMYQYHTHPLSAGEYTVTWAASELEKKMEGVDAKTIKKFLTAIMYLYTSFPSDGDVRAYADWSEVSQKLGVAFYGKIASPIGITTIEIKNAGNDTVKRYEMVHRDLYRIMHEGKYVQ
ncbi:MAG: hypothetical protein Q7K45_07235, partial [Nanoarchaeota archaeon]|nr:hypothetical protein [Nanoarchaeota archaeon]